jgi:hypothetical protein
MIKKGLIAGLVNFVVGLILTFGVEKLFSALRLEYQKVAIFRPFTDPLMMVYFAYPFILGIVAAYLWGIVAKDYKGSVTAKAWKFAMLYFVIATIPGMFISYTTFQVSLGMILSWTLTGLIEIFVAGLVFAKIK